MSEPTFESSLHRDRADAGRSRVEFDEVPGEHEADAVRDAFLQSAGNAPATQATALGQADPAVRARAVHRLQDEQGNAYLQRLVASRGTPGRLVGLSQADMVSEVQQRKGSGAPLPEPTLQRMNGFFGADLSGVRVHADSEASALTSELNAKAFTVGRDVFMGEGQYDPSSQSGQGLLAHELTHVGQQGGFGAPSIQREAEEEEAPPAEEGGESEAAQGPEEAE